MIPTVEQVLPLAAALLGDELQRKFTNTYLLRYWPGVYAELMDEMMANVIPKQKRIATYPLVAQATSVTPATVGISNFGELVQMRERRYLSSDYFLPMREVTQLPQRQMSDRLIDFEWRNDTFYFVGATVGVELEISYMDSGEAPTTGSTGIDGALNFFAYRLAAMAGPPKGYWEMSEQLDKQARGKNLDGNSGFLFKLIQPMVTALQRVQLEPPVYMAGGGPLNLIQNQPVVIGSNGGDVALVTVIPTGTIDGVNETFTLPSAPTKLLLFKNGQLLDEDTAYTLTGATITMLAGYIPQTGDSLRAEIS